MKYYVISEILEKSEYGTLVKPFCVVQDELIAKDLCEKNPNYEYVENELNADLCPASLSDDCESKGLYDDVVCPYCGAKHFSMGYTTSTALYVPQIFINGKLVDNGIKNHTTTHCHCCNCGKDFTFDEKHEVHKAD